MHCSVIPVYYSIVPFPVSPRSLMQIESRTNPVRKIIHAALESAHREKRCASVECNDPLCAVHNESGLREVLSIDWLAGTGGATEEDVSLLRGSRETRWV